MGMFSSLFGGGGSAKRAAGVQAGGYDQAAKIYQQRYQQTRKDFAPYMEQGAGALGRYGDIVLGGDLGQFRESPGYQFRLKEGLGALEKSAAARGGMFTGGTGKALQRYGQEMASQEYTNYLNQLNQLMGYGYGATGQVSQIGAGLASGEAQARIGQAGAQAGGMRSKAAQLAAGGEQLLGLGTTALTGGIGGRVGGALGGLFGGQQLSPADQYGIQQASDPTLPWRTA